MDRSEFVSMVEQAVDTLPEEFKRRLNNVAIVVEDWPNDHQMRKLGRGLLFGLYEGVPQVKRGAHYSALPDKITIFQGPIEHVATDEADMIHRIQSTVEHEIGHHFGLNEHQARARDMRKKGT